jgi:LysR family glycine cleavage system transcriptional activator
VRQLPPLSELRAFEAAARRVSFKLAGEELGVTPSAISHHIQHLESYCGCRLFHRNPRGMELTAEGDLLYAAVKQGLDIFTAAIAAVRDRGEERPLKLTATNAFASRLLVPRVADWAKSLPGKSIEIIGTDDVIDLWKGDADVAIRYARTPPKELAVHELVRDNFYPICSPKLLSQYAPITCPKDLLRLPIIHCIWPDWNTDAPTWQRWSQAMRQQGHDVSEITQNGGIGFREELHAIEAVIAGSGVSILSDVVVGRELKTGVLVKALDLPISGMSFYLVHVPGHLRPKKVTALLAWLTSALRGDQ